MKPSINSLESIAVKNQIDFYVSQSLTTHPDNRKFYDERIKDLSSRYKVLTGEYYKYEKREDIY
jgi:hypothetical protein